MLLLLKIAPEKRRVPYLYVSALSFFKLTHLSEEFADFCPLCLQFQLNRFCHTFLLKFDTDFGDLFLSLLHKMAEGGFATFEESNANETARLVAAANANSPAVVLGDNNNGPINTSVSLISPNPNAFALWAAGGLQSASLLLGRYECTYCGRSNPLLSNLLPENDQLVDHILLTSQYHNSVIEVQVGVGIALTWMLGFALLVQLTTLVTWLSLLKKKKKKR